MITAKIIPVATATSQELLVEITENVCRPYCVENSVTPTASVTFEVGRVRVVNGNAIAPLIAHVTVMTPASGGCGCAKAQVFTEVTDIAFVESGTNEVTLAEGASVVQTPAYVKCGKAYGVKLTTTLTATIA